MTAGLGRGIALAATGVVVGLAIVAALFGSGDLLKRVRGNATPGEPSRSIADLPPGGNANTETPVAKSDKPRSDTGNQAAIDPNKNPLAGPERSRQAETRQGGATMTPSLDIIRVEPSGDTVLAGRGAPKVAIELLRDNQTVARVTTDESGQFAIDSLALPPGNSELTLRSTAPDGTTTDGKASAVVVVDKDRKAQPLVAVSEPDKPTRVFSMPGPTAEAGKDTGKPSALGEKSETLAPRREAALPGAGGKTGAPAVGSTAIKIVSVDAQEGGRLFVSGQGAAWTSLRLYLNDTLVASGRSGADGRIGFTIGRGVKPGGYQIRIDQVDAESGKVGNRAQVGFIFPTQLSAKEPAQEPVRTASKDAAPAASAPGSAETSAVAPSAAKPSTTAHPAVASSASRPTTAVPSPEADTHMVEALSPKLSGTENPAGTDARAANPVSPAPGAAGRSRLANPPRPAENPSSTTPASDRAASAEPAPAPNDQAAAVFVPEISTAKIIRGDSLWQISRKTYGNGKRYTVIYDANQEQIRNPDLIFPGQIFVLPKDSPGADGQGAKRG